MHNCCYIVFNMYDLLRGSLGIPCMTVEREVLVFYRDISNLFMLLSKRHF